MSLVCRVCIQLGVLLGLAANLPHADVSAASIVDLASRGDVKSIREQIAKSKDLDKPKEGKTALMVAADRGDSAVVGLLLAAGAEVNRRATEKGDEVGCTALMYAAQKGEVAVVRQLLAHGADVALHQAASVVSLHNIQGSSDDTTWFQRDAILSLPDSIVIMGDSLRILARNPAPNGAYLDSLRFRLHSPVWVIRSDGGNSALTLAVAAGHAEVARELVAAGASPVDRVFWRSARFSPGVANDAAAMMTKLNSKKKISSSMVYMPGTSVYPAAFGSAVEIARHLHSDDLLRALEPSAEHER